MDSFFIHIKENIFMFDLHLYIIWFRRQNIVLVVAVTFIFIYMDFMITPLFVHRSKYFWSGYFYCKNPFPGLSFFVWKLTLHFPIRYSINSSTKVTINSKGKKKGPDMEKRERRNYEKGKMKAQNAVLMRRRNISRKPIFTSYMH